MERRCPTCRVPVADDASAFPFCCERCRLVDLGSWFDERFRVGGSDEEDVRAIPDSDADSDEQH